MVSIFWDAFGKLFDWVIFAASVQMASRLRINQSVDWGRLWGMGSSRMANSFSFDEDNIIPGTATLGYIDRQTSFSRKQLSTKVIIPTTTLSQ